MMSTERALPISIEAARTLSAAGTGLVVVLLREQQVVGVLHLPPGSPAAAGPAAVAAQADQAVLVIVGAFKIAGRLIVEADETRKALAAVGVEVTGTVYTSTLKVGQRWTDLSLNSPRDGIIGRLFRQRG